MPTAIRNLCQDSGVVLQSGIVHHEIAFRRLQASVSQHRPITTAERRLHRAWERLIVPGAPRVETILPRVTECVLCNNRPQ